MLLSLRMARELLIEEGITNPVTGLAPTRTQIDNRLHKAMEDGVVIFSKMNEKANAPLLIDSSKLIKFYRTPDAFPPAGRPAKNPCVVGKGCRGRRSLVKGKWLCEEHR